MIILFFILFIIEALHDKAVIDEMIARGGKDTDESRIYNKAWHSYSSFMAVIIFAVVAYACHSIHGYHWALTVITGMMVRYWCMTYALNHFRGKNLEHLGTNPIDKMAASFGAIPSFIISTLTILVLAAVEILYYV